MKKGFYSILITLIIFVVTYSFINYQDTSDTKQSEKAATPTPTQKSERTPEGVLRDLDGETVPVTGPLTVEIISPEGDSFMMSQARMYSATVSNMGNNKGVCHWKFYLNEYEEETLYREQDTQVTGGDTCGFTSTFIDRRGNLRVEVVLEVQDRYSSETLQTVSDEALYKVL